MANAMRKMEFPADLDLGPKMQACSERERRFVWFYVTNADENATQAARDAGYPDTGSGGIGVRAHALMHRERVLEAIDEVGRQAFRALLVPAIAATRRLILNSKHPDHARTLQATLARLGLVERTGVDVTVGGEITVNHTDEALNHLRFLKELQVPRGKLEEMFGFSGLERYEKMLAVADARAPKVIENEATNG